MKVIGGFGWKETGKTTLIEKLIKEFNLRNLTVSTIKHSHHNVSLDRQGTDSFRHFNAGSKETILSSDSKCVKFSRQISESETILDNLMWFVIFDMNHKSNATTIMLEYRIVQPLLFRVFIHFGNYSNSKNSWLLLWVILSQIAFIKKSIQSVIYKKLKIESET